MSNDADNHALLAGQLVEAALRAREGDSEAAKTFIARAVALLGGDPNTISTGLHPLNRSAPKILPGGLAAWQKRRLVAYIDAHIDGRIQIKELAQLLNLSQGHFSRAFRSAFGTPAHAYLTRRRIELAQGLMLTTRETLAAIAVRCGLSDQSHFTRVFRRIVGETPYAWRRSRHGEIEDLATEHLIAPARSSRKSVTSVVPDQGHQRAHTAVDRRRK